MAKSVITKKEKPIEELLWDSANNLRGKVESSEDKHFVLGLIFLKFASDKFEERRMEKKVATPKFTTPIELLLNASKVLQNCRNKKEVKNDLFLQLAPPIGESYNFNAMKIYLTLRKILY